jgi:aminoglycoside phosphotransferase family enzyme/predicted kinase
MDPLIKALHDPAAYPHPTEAITLVETHISWVLLTGPYAYKIKKPVSLGFVDFSTLERRTSFCQEELRLNQRLAPEIYLEVVEIHGPRQHANLRGMGPVIEVAVRMRQFDQAGLLPTVLAAGTPIGEPLERFAQRLAAFHGAAAVAATKGPFGTPQAVIAPALANLEVLRRLHPNQELLSHLEEWTVLEAHRLEADFSRRLELGRVREGHGDLHLGNLVLHQGEVVGFDCLEFNAGLRWIDVLSDVAFLCMDLQRHGEPVLAGRVLNHWLIGCGDYGALATWPWYLTYRALVRGKVLALRMEQLGDDNAAEREALQRQLRSYLQQAQRSSGPTPPGALLLTHGVTGSGKSHLASQLCQRHGWIHLRSDVERRRLFGRWGTALGPLREGEAYTPEVTAELYADLLPTATEKVLQAGLTAVVDATFLHRSQRQHFIALAERLQAPWLIVHSPVSPEVARARITKRACERRDPSEADVHVLEQQWQEQEPFDDSEAVLSVNGGTIEEVEALLAVHLPGILRTTR